MPINPSTGKTNPKDDEKKKAPPPIMVRTAPRATLWERLREIKKKDLAFILAGLAILILAPIAQHYLMRPGEGQLLEPGFSTREGLGGKAPYDQGLNMLSDGGPVGGELITPLTGRDPSSLLSPPGGPPAPAKPAAQEGIRDALNRALQASAPKAVEQAALPRPRGSLATALQGLAALAGSSYAGGESAPLLGQGVSQAAQSVPSRAAPRNYAGPLPLAGYQGPVQGLDKSSRDAIEALRAQAGKAAGEFNRTGNGVTDLGNAAKESINPGGSSSGGLGPQSGTSTNQAASQFPPGNVSLGEGLDYLAAKMRQEKAIELEFKKRELMEMLPYKIFEQGMTKMFGAVGDWAADGVKDMLNPSDPDAGKYSCCQGTIQGTSNPDPATCSAPIKATPVGNKLYVKIAGSGDKDPGSEAPQDCPGGIVPAWVWKAWQTNPYGPKAGPGAGGGATPQVAGVSGEKAVGPAYVPEPYWEAMRPSAAAAAKAASGLDSMTAHARPADVKAKAEGLLALLGQAVDSSSQAAANAQLLGAKTAEFYGRIHAEVNGDQNHYGIDKNEAIVEDLLKEDGGRIDQMAAQVEAIKPKALGGTFDHFNADLLYKQAGDQVSLARDDLKRGQGRLAALKAKQAELHAIDGRASQTNDDVALGARETARQAGVIRSRAAAASKLVEEVARARKPSPRAVLRLQQAVREIAGAAQWVGKAVEKDAVQGSAHFKPEAPLFDQIEGDFNTIGPTIQGDVDPDPARGMLGKHLYAEETGAQAIVAASTKIQQAASPAQAKK